MEKLAVTQPKRPDFYHAKILTKEAWETIKWLKPLNEPIWYRAEDSDYMQPHDPVLGLYLNQQAWALPWWILKNHHAANLILDDQPILITFCEMCNSAAAFVPTSQGQKYTFRVMGCYNGTILISDFETDSFWAPFKGEAVYGSLKGMSFEQLPLYQCFWSEWVKQHPTTSVLYSHESLRQGHGSRHSPGSRTMGATFASTLLKPIDDRLPYQILVLGVKNDRVARAYPLLALNTVGSVLNDTLGTDEIVIFHIPGDLQALAFSRELNNEILFFQEIEPGVIIDRNTGSYWNYMGECYEGLLKGNQLSFISSGINKWFIWAADYPETELFETENFSRLLCHSSPDSF